MSRKKFLLISYTNPPTRTLAVMEQHNIPAETILVKYATHNLEAHEILHREGYLVEYIIFDLTEFPPRSISIVPIIWNMWHELRKKVMFLFPEEESIPAVIWRELHKAGLPQEFDIKKFLSHRKDERKFAEAA